MRVPQAARVLQISERTTWDWVNIKKLEVIRPSSGITLITMRSIRELLAQGANQPPRPPRGDKSTKQQPRPMARQAQAASDATDRAAKRQRLGESTKRQRPRRGGEADAARV
jgi:hypothetical protein